MGGTSESIILGGGCFWCVEAAFEQLDGVEAATSGYAGGEEPNPDYRLVCSGTTGHIEVVKIDYDPAKTNLETIFNLFFRIHDPTSLNRQGADAGWQYRSIIMVNGPDQRAAAEAAIKTAQAKFAKPIVTEIRDAPRFWLAEDYHQDYYAKNPDAGYCRVVIAPKLEKAGLKP